MLPEELTMKLSRDEAVGSSALLGSVASTERKHVHEQAIGIGNHKASHAEAFITQFLCDTETTLQHRYIGSIDVFDLYRDDDALCWMLKRLRCELVIAAHDADLKLSVGRRCHLDVPPRMLEAYDEIEKLPVKSRVSSILSVQIFGSSRMTATSPIAVSLFGMAPQQFNGCNVLPLNVGEDRRTVGGQSAPTGRPRQSTRQPSYGSNALG
jgi:hypothetical protein